jgi:hypothetical protein
MTDNRATREKQPQAGNASKEKKVYQKPAFRYEQVFETQALACGKIDVGKLCSFSKKTS